MRIGSKEYMMVSLGLAHSPIVEAANLLGACVTAKDPDSFVKAMDAYAKCREKHKDIIDAYIAMCFLDPNHNPENN